MVLADQYDRLLGDPPAAAVGVALLREAWTIDPQSREVADAFRRRGFRRRNDHWVEPPPPNRGDPNALPRSAETEGENTSTGTSEGVIARPMLAGPANANSLRGLTPQEVRTRLGGKPDRIVRSASQGQFVEQWIYLGARQDQFVNFLHNPGEPLPKVVAFYARPHNVYNPPKRP